MAKAAEKTANSVLDASAFLAMIKSEPGWDRVAVALPTAAMSSVNAAEVYSKLSEWNVSREEHARCHAVIKDRIIPFDADLAYRTGALRGATMHKGLSLADRACLALAQRMGVRAITSDKTWAELNVKIDIEVIR